MVPYIIRRLLWMVPTLLAMALITFAIMHLTPGSPLDPVADNANPLSPEAQRNMAKQYGLDKPLWQQFVIFLTKAVRGDFGTSYVYKNRAVHEIIRQAFPVSLHLGGMALAVALVGGLTLGISAAVYQNRPVDYLCSLTAMLAVALPNFVVAVFFILLFSLVLQLVPTGGWMPKPLAPANIDPGAGAYGNHCPLHPLYHDRCHSGRFCAHCQGQRAA